MHILLVSFEFPPDTATGGIGSYMYHLAKLLYKNGFTVTVFSALPAGSSVQLNKEEAYQHYTIPAADNKEFKKNAATFFEAYIQTNTVDIVESPEVGACALEIKRNHPHIPLIVKMHTPGIFINKISRHYQPLGTKLRYVAGALLRGRLDAGYWATKDRNQKNDDEYIICTLADRLLSPSAALKNWAVRYWGIAAEKITVVPNPFSMNDALFSLPLQGRPKQISFIGKLSVLKGMKAFTKAIPKILDKNPGYILLLVGRDETEDGQSMKAFMEQQLGAYKHRIGFAGALTTEELVKVYTASRLCIFPSLWENYPTVVLEAMAAGAAVAASERGGIPEMIEDGRTGILFDPLKPEDIAGKVNGLLGDDTALLNMASTARAVLKEQLQDASFEEKILSVYNAVQH